MNNSIAQEVDEIKITHHAYKRAKERCGLSRKSLDRLYFKVIENGLCHKETKGNLSKYISGIYEKNKDDDKEILLYGHYVFIFQDTLLITIYLIPTDLRNLLSICKEEKEKADESNSN